MKKHELRNDKEKKMRRNAVFIAGFSAAFLLGSATPFMSYADNSLGNVADEQGENLDEDGVYASEKYTINIYDQENGALLDSIPDVDFITDSAEGYIGYVLSLDRENLRNSIVSKYLYPAEFDESSKMIKLEARKLGNLLIDFDRSQDLSYEMEVENSVQKVSFLVPDFNESGYWYYIKKQDSNRKMQVGENTKYDLSWIYGEGYDYSYNGQDLTLYREREKTKEDLRNEIDKARLVLKEYVFINASENKKNSYTETISRAEEACNSPNFPGGAIQGLIEELEYAKAELDGRDTDASKLLKEFELKDRVLMSIKFKKSAVVLRQNYENAIDAAKRSYEQNGEKKSQTEVNDLFSSIETARTALNGTSQETSALNETVTKAEAEKNTARYRMASTAVKASYEAAVNEAKAILANEWASEEETAAGKNKLNARIEEIRNSAGSGSLGNNNSSNNNNSGSGSTGRGGSGGAAGSGRGGSGGGTRRAGKALGAVVKTGMGNTAAIKAVTTNKASLNSGKWTNVNGKWKLNTNSEASLNSKVNFASSQWAMVDSKWYVFDHDEYMCTGLVKVNNVNYYFNADGAMMTGWVQLGGKWYYFDTASGAMKTGWVNTSDKWYFLKSDGSMAVNEATSDGYKVDANGVWIK